MKPKDTPENMKKCICGKCPVYTDCNKKKMEGLFCAMTKSACPMNQKKMCICGSCRIYSENKLSGGYFCIKELK